MKENIAQLFENQAGTLLTESTTTASSGLTPKANFELSVVYDLGVARIGFAHDAASASAHPLQLHPLPHLAVH